MTRKADNSNSQIFFYFK